ncbi:MAG: TatD family hydrolase [Xanthomonadales bacterium]|nr:TatD family hydrolase [Xanthomonadales bacterium]MCC6562303.1 TatD family hydrolase [Xanthomonadales bacterium]
MRLIDSHCHLDATEFDADRDAVSARARDAGVIAQILPAVAAEAFPALAALCRGRRDRFAAYGLHPVYLEQHRDADLQQIEAFIEREGAVAVGECGLDYFVGGLDRERQRSLFAAQLRMAREFDLPLILHARRAVDEVIQWLRRERGLRGVVHSFSGSLEQAQQLWALGFHLGIGGPVTYERAQRLRGIVAAMPIEWLLLESDAPDQPNASARGARNEPASIVEVAAVVAGLRGVDAANIAAATTANAVRLFGLDQAGFAAS